MVVLGSLRSLQKIEKPIVSRAEACSIFSNFAGCANSHMQIILNEAC